MHGVWVCGGRRAGGGWLLGRRRGDVCAQGAAGGPTQEGRHREASHPREAKSDHRDGDPAWWHTHAHAHNYCMDYCGSKISNGSGARATDRSECLDIPPPRFHRLQCPTWRWRLGAGAGRGADVLCVYMCSCIMRVRVTAHLQKNAFPMSIPYDNINPAQSPIPFNLQSRERGRERRPDSWTLVSRHLVASVRHVQIYVAKIATASPAACVPSLSYADPIKCGKRHVP